MLMHLGRTSFGLQTYKHLKKLHITAYHKSKMQDNKKKQKKKKTSKLNKIWKKMGKKKVIDLILTCMLNFLVVNLYL